MTKKHVRYDATPKFDGSNYKRWKTLVKMWEKVTDIDESKQGAALILNMSGRALDVALSSASPESTTVTQVIELLDAVYIDEDDLLMKCDEFDRMVRKPDQNMKEFVYVYDQKVEILKKEEVVIPDIVLATKILRAANLPESHYLIARQSCTSMTYANAKKALIRISEKTPGKPSSNTDSPNMVKVKEELLDYDGQSPVMYNNMDYGGSYDSETLEPTNDVYYQNGNKRQQPNRSLHSQRGNCFSCGDNGHLYRDCPNRYDRNRNQNRQCYGCGDRTHWLKDCPYLRDLQSMIRNMRQTNNIQSGKYQNTGKKSFSSRTFLSEEEDYNHPEQNCVYDGQIQEPEKQVLFLKNDVGNEVEDILLVGETVNKAVLDSGASKTVCGNEWYKCYVDSLEEKSRSLIKEYSSDTIFRFGVGRLKASKMVHLPVTLCNNEITLEVHVVNTDIPLLLSLKTMKTMGIQIDFETDRVTLNGEVYLLETTSTGHYTLDLVKRVDDCKDVLVSTVSECERIKEADAKKKALKLHRRFAHANSKRIIELLRTSGKSDKVIEEELQKIQNSCDFCLKHRRASPRPTVCLPLAREFNEVVAMDLKKIDGVWILHCIDYLTRFSAAHTVRSHEPDEVMDKFFMIWISMFGPPQKILSDNGGEFQGEKWESICGTFNITHRTTSAESPFSNGVCERHNLLVAEMTEKIREDVGCSLNIALMWAVHAKNSLVNIHGFSPYQLVFGRNPNVPGNSNNLLPAMTSETSSKIVADHLNGLRAARHAYVKAESSDRIARALRGKVFEGTYKKFCVGDTVYYKRKDNKIWKGPGVVIAQVGTEVLVKSNAGRLVKVHPCKLVLKQEADRSVSAGEIPDEEEHHSGKSDSSSDSESETVEILSKEQNREQVSIDNKNSRSDQNVSMTEESPLSVSAECDLGKNLHLSKRKPKKDLVKVGDRIYYKEDDDEWKIVTVLGRGGKAGGQWENYWNVKDLKSGHKHGLNLDSVDWIKEDPVPQEINYLANEILRETYAQHVEIPGETENSENHVKAKENEIQKWKDFNVFEEVDKNDYPNQELISCRWVNESKQKRNEMVYKYRLVARGFQETEPPVSDSPTAQKSIARVCITLCNMFNWTIEGLDIRAAFLQSNELDRVVLMKPPKEFKKNNNTVWRIKKPIYGLNDGARKWYITLKAKLTEYGCKPLTLDPSVYTYQVQNQLCGFLVLHVDDFLIGGNTLFYEDVVSRLISDFKVSSRKKGQFMYVGWEIHQTKKYIEVDQTSYQVGIKPIEINSAKSKGPDHEVSASEKKQYQQLLGKLQWISSQTRPDIRYAVLECSISANKPKVKDILRINKVVKKMNKTSVKLHFGIPGDSMQDLQILAFSDASLSNLPDQVSSTRSFVIFLNGGGKVTPISWCSKKLERVAKTIIYAEGIALGKCLDAAINLKQTILEMLPSKSNIPIIGITDSKSLWDNIQSTSQCEDLKLRREVASIKEQLDLKEVTEIKWTPTHLQLADCLTKASASSEMLIKVITSGEFKF